MNSIKRVVLPVALGVFTLGTTSAFATWLELVPTLSGDTTSSPGAITPDGKYVVGKSTGTSDRGFLWQVGSGAANATVVLSSDNVLAQFAAGVGYRTYNANQELIISGFATSGHVVEWMTMDGGLTFGVKRRNTSYTLNSMNSYNMLGSPGNTDEYFVTSRDTSQLLLDINRGTGAWPATIDSSTKSVTAQARMQGIGATGAAVGSRVNGGIRSNYRMDYVNGGSPLNGYFQGLNTVDVLEGEAWDVSDDGLYVAGWSHLGTTGDSYAYKAIFSGLSAANWMATYQLPVTGLEAGSVAKTVAYGISPDGRYIVGGSYQNAYHAILWDTGDANPANWTYLDLTDFATSQGILDGWTSLDRGFSVGLDPNSGAPVVTGLGTYSGQNRTFVLLVPEPSAVWMLLVGLGALIGRNIWMRKRA